jgi:nifR3 family TIM-barrel protein
MKIGTLIIENNMFLAPMAGITHPVFRWMVKEVSGAIGFTEMVSAEGLVRAGEKTLKYLESFPCEKPFAVQIFGADPAALADAAQIAVANGGDLVDINMGCPVRKVVKAKAGAALLRNPEKLPMLLKRVRNVLSVPLTIKIRSGWTKDKINALEIALIAQDAGVDAVILHPRTAAQGFSGKADWKLIRVVKKAVSIPVIGSGDVRTSEDAIRMLDETGCDGVMIGRGTLGNPWIFGDIRNALEGRKTVPPSLVDREKVICRHLERNVKFFGEKEGVKDFYRHLAWYTKGLRGCTLLRKQVLGLPSYETVEAAIHHFFGRLSVSP